MPSLPPIGMFDSGLGGLSVWQSLHRQLPQVPILYAADSARCPYGPRPKQDILAFSHQMTRWLLDQGAQLIVVACNTATAAAIHELRATYDVPFVGMEPAIKPAAEQTASGVVGILATEGTFKGDHFQRAAARHGQDISILTQEGKGLVAFVESGELTGKRVEQILYRYLMPMLEAGADQIVLGCSHYPFLRLAMQQIVGDAAHIIDPAPAVARQAIRLYPGTLTEETGTTPIYPFFTSGRVPNLRQFVASITSGAPIPATFAKISYPLGRIYLPMPAHQS